MLAWGAGASEGCPHGLMDRTSPGGLLPVQRRRGPRGEADRPGAIRLVGRVGGELRARSSRPLGLRGCVTSCSSPGTRGRIYRPSWDFDMGFVTCLGMKSTILCTQ